jgi:IS4 transposase
MIQLVGGANEEGYSHALYRAFSQSRASKVPHKSSLCRMRKRISHLFFRDLQQELLDRVQKAALRWRGLRVFGIDGQMITLPRFLEMEKEGYSGRKISTYRESYYPKGFITHAYDVLAGITQDFTFSPRLNEQADAFAMVKNFERQSLTLYDRLYFSKKLVRLHFKLGNFFLFRLRRNAHAEIETFFHSKKKTGTMMLDGKSIRLIKIKNPNKRHETAVFATNLPEDLARDAEIWKLYRLRWEVETSFRELTGITKAEQWHSKTFNGVLQEIYCKLFLINYTKAQRNRSFKAVQNPLSDTYRKANFKLLRNWILMNFPRILRRNTEVWVNFRAVTIRSLERRKREKRRYPRELKQPASPYKYNNCIWRV